MLDLSSSYKKIISIYNNLLIQFESIVIVKHWLVTVIPFLNDSESSTRKMSFDGDQTTIVVN